MNSAREVPVAEPVLRYAVRIVRRINPEMADAPPDVKCFARYDSSPRGLRSLGSVFLKRCVSQSCSCIGHIPLSPRVYSMDTPHPLDVTGGTMMRARMNSPVMTLPGAMEALQALAAATEDCGVPRKTLDLVDLRGSQINGCSVCLDMHTRGAKRRGETDQRLFTVAAWREAPYFSDAERAALALTEAATRIGDRADPVPDEVFNEAAKHYDQRALAALVLRIGLINLWNRLNVTTGLVAGEWTGQWA